MPITDPRIDAYIESAKPFAQPILKHLRKVIHKACPDIEEKYKWSSPHFDYQGPVCHMAAFKEHCAFGFWKSALLKDPEGLFTEKDNAMGVFGRILSIKDLPSEKILIAYIKEAIDLNVAGIKVSPGTRPKSVPASQIETPDYVTKALKANAVAKQAWDAFAPSHRKEYLEWITSAKTEATRDKRLATMIEWVGEGKQRHWKYQQ